MTRSEFESDENIVWYGYGATVAYSIPLLNWLIFMKYTSENLISIFSTFHTCLPPSHSVTQTSTTHHWLNVHNCVQIWKVNNSWTKSYSLIIGTSNCKRKVALWKMPIRCIDLGKTLRLNHFRFVKSAVKTFEIEKQLVHECNLLHFWKYFKVECWVGPTGWLMSSPSAVANDMIKPVFI